MYLINLNKNDLKWLQKALNKKDIRWFCGHILVKEGYAYATNGHVIHKIKCAWDEQEGLYDFNGIKLNNEDNMLHPLQKNNIKMFEGFNDEVSLVVMPSKLSCLKMSETMGINRGYFENAVDKANEIVVKLHSEDKDRIYLHYDNREVVMMGMRIKE